MTEVDTLKADPFAFYARKVLKVSPIDPVDADPSPAWRGNQVHAILQDWFERGRRRARHACARAARNC